MMGVLALSEQKVLAHTDVHGRVYEHARDDVPRCFADKGYYDQIKNELDSLEARSLKRFREVLVQARDALISRVTRGRTLPAPRGFRLKGMTDFRFEVRDMLERASTRGGLDARREVREGRREVKNDQQKVWTHAAPAVYRPRNAAAWMREKEFYVTDLLDSAITENVRGILVNGLKTGELNAVVADKIWTAFEAYIGDPTTLRDGEPLSPARLETIVRTNLTDAYNHGRMMEYTSDEMLPFLNAIRYSAILDERTTPVCSFLDGKLFDPIDPDLTDLLPPNHFNCRSIVVPVVVGEVVDIEDFITPEEVGHAKELADAKFLTLDSGPPRDKEKKARVRVKIRPHVIEKRGLKWVLLTRDRSRVLGTHDSKADAEAQERAIEAGKHA